MKKLLLTVLIVAVTFSFVFAAARTDLLTEGFEGSFPPTGWHIKNMGDEPAGETWMESAYLPHSGTYKAFSQDGASGNAMNEWLVTDAISVPADENLTLIFWHYLEWATWNDGPEHILISTTDTAVASFTDTIFTLPGDTPTSWDSVNLDLAMTYAGETIYIAFVHTSAGGYADAWCLDDIYMFSALFAPGPGDVILNELNIKTGSEWIELYNTTSIDIPLDSFHLMVASGPFDSILVGDTILANDYKVIYFPSNHL
ncbi:choice-of-anchor J domain-containing protein, partial [candidate division WOR-3 bacterium]|nr:choice-of-anchor J domain-containing protein [candidate division WOR-3 bacterium]